MHTPEQLALIDLRSVVEFGRVHVPHSINIPFATVQLGERRLEALQVPQLEAHLRQRIVVCVSNIHQHAVEVGLIYIYIYTYKYLMYNILISIYCSSPSFWSPAASYAPAFYTRASMSYTQLSQIYSSRIDRAIQFIQYCTIL